MLKIQNWLGQNIGKIYLPATKQKAKVGFTYIRIIFTSLTLFFTAGGGVLNNKGILCKFVKGSVSRVLRWVLLYIIQKLFSRPIIASHKILTLLKGQFTIYKNWQPHPCTMIWFYQDNIEIAGKWVFPQY